jgi:DNA-binding SARP family transcriptional activator
MIRVLGPIQIVDDEGQPIDLPSVSQRRLLAVLALHAPGPARAERLAAILDVSASGLRTAITRLRRALGDASIVAGAGGYRLTTPVDAERFRAALAGVPADGRLVEVGVRLAALEDALSWWRGPPFDEFAAEEWAAGEVARLTELHAAATEDHADELIAADRCPRAIAELAEHIARHPLRDRARGLVIRAFAGSGRQADALRAYQQYRRMLTDEVGTEPSLEVRGIEQRVAGGWNGSTRTTVRQPTRPVAELPVQLANARDGPFVGRASAVADLFESWLAGQWHALLVGGEPGIGKTRLLAELADRMRDSGRPVFVGRGDEDLVVSYRPWRELLAPLVATMTDEQEVAVGPEHLRELSRVVPSLSRRMNAPVVVAAADADARRALLVDAVIQLLRVVGPAVLVIDDVHWIDQPSLQLLQHVLIAAPADVTILGAYRDTDVDGAGPLPAALADLRQVDGVRRSTLGGIDDAAVAQLLEWSVGRELDAEDLSAAQGMHARSAGNPLFVRELIRHRADGGEGADLPQSLVELIYRRVSRLGDEALAVLRIAAAVGHRFDVAVVEETAEAQHASRGELAQTIDVLAQLEVARDAGVIVDDGIGMEFRHAVIRAALLGQLSTPRRERLHRHIAAALERVIGSSVAPHLEELAYHHDRARSADAPRWYERAATAAAASLDPTAVRLADRGLELLDDQRGDPTVRCDLLIARALGMRLGGSDSLADAQLAAHAAIALGDQERIARALLSLSVRSSDRDMTDHVAFLADGLAHLTDPSLASRWSVVVSLAVRKTMMPSADAGEHHRELHEVVRHLDPRDPSACRIAMRCARSLTDTSLPHEALPIVERFAPGCQGLDSDGLPIELGVATMWLHLGNRQEFDRYLDSAATDPLRRYWAFDCQVRQRLALRHLLEARWSAAEDEIGAVGAHAALDPNLLLGCTAQTTWLRRETGETEASYQRTRQMVEAHPGLLLPQALLAADAAEAGLTDIAREQLDRLGADAYASAGRQWMTVIALGHLAWAAVAVGATEHAPELRRLLAGYEGQMAVIGTGVHVLCSVDRLLAGLADVEGDRSGADRLFAAALAQERALGSPPLQARTQHWWGRALLRRGDLGAAEPMLRQSRSAAQSLGMAGLVRQIDALEAS